MPRFEGTVKRTRPRVNVMRGYTGNEPQSLSRSAPCSSSAVGFIKSGQAIALNASEEWVLATTTDAVVYIAYHDSDDTDVKSCGKLLGFSALGSYEIETAYTTSTGLTAANAAGLGVCVSTTPGTLSIAAAGDTAAAGGGTDIILGRTSTAAVDLSTGQRGGYAVNLGEDDSSDAWGSAVAAQSGTNTIENSGTGGGDVIDITLTEANGTLHAVQVTAGATDAATETLIIAAINAAQTSSASLDAAIESVLGDGAGVVTVTTRPGTAYDLTSTNANDDSGGGGGQTITAVDVAGSNGTAATSKEVLRWVTTAS